ncbi:hypothetical protein MTR67_035220 [Solanum verrucosum]|uniref:Uncharacterized protein n=1 Tax=Solanum verrucosum TaxID=315347 RepID=A0AAF0U9X6_SOLVR|nr:hypothetical protein MTR67_035220 [Solanum verrucosum]
MHTGTISSFEYIQIHRALTDDEQLLKAHLAMEYEELRKSSVNQRSSGGFLPDFVQETERWRPSLNILDVRIITEEEQVWLSRDFEEEEVLEGINSVVDKAPGPDGYTIAFFPAFWEIIKDGEDQALWKEKIRRKFGQQDLRCTTEVTETYGVVVWKTIRNFWGGGVLTLIGGFAGTTLEPNKLAWGHHKDRRFPVNRLYNWRLRGNDPLDLEAHYGKVWPQPR